MFLTRGHCLPLLSSAVALRTEPVKISSLISPLVGRELLAYARQPWTYWLRALATLGAVVLLAVLAVTGRNRLGSTDGRALFQSSAAILFLLASSLLVHNGLFLSALLAMAPTGIWLGIKLRSLAKASFSTVAYLVLLPGALYVFQPIERHLLLAGLILVYGTVALVMHRRVKDLIQGGDRLQRIFRGGD